MDKLAIFYEELLSFTLEQVEFQNN